MTRRSPCPVACTLDLVGDRWTLLVIRDLACGRRHFKDFLASPEGISTNILAARLSRLVEDGLAERYSESESPHRPAYRLTSRGRSLLPLLQAIANWGVEHIEGTEIRMSPVEP